MRRYFTLDEAQRLLPEISEALIRMKALLEISRQADSEIQQTARRIVHLGGISVDLRRMAALKRRRDTSSAHVKQLIESVHSHGCLIKDLETGLVDFPTLYKGQEVYLCWKLGERGITYWHGLEEGFRGRKPVDRDFIDHHYSE